MIVPLIIAGAALFFLAGSKGSGGSSSSVLRPASSFIATATKKGTKVLSVVTDPSGGHVKALAQLKKKFPSYTVAAFKKSELFDLDAAGELAIPLDDAEYPITSVWVDFSEMGEEQGEMTYAELEAFVGSSLAQT